MKALQFTLTAEDFWRLQLYVYARKRRRRYLVLAAYVIIFAIVSLFPGMHFPLLLVLAILFAGSLFGLAFLLMRLNARRSVKSLQNRGVHTVSIDAAGMKYATEQSTTSVLWRGLRSIEEDKYSLYFQQDSPGAVFVAYIIPKRAFQTPAEAETFIGNARNYWQQANAGDR